MALMKCPECGKEIGLFGPSKVEEWKKKYGVPASARMPLDPSLSALSDAGRIAEADTDPLAEIFFEIERSREIKDYLK